MDANGTRPLEDLVQWNGELSGLIGEARHCEPTSTVTFRRGHATAAAEKVITGLVEPSRLVDWAQAVHFAEEVHFEEGHQDLLAQFLFEISTPELFEPVTREVCRRWLRVLQTSVSPGTEASGRQTTSRRPVTERSTTDQADTSPRPPERENPHNCP